MCLFSQTRNMIFSSVSLILLGGAFGICNISLGTVFQKLIPNKIMGRVSSLSSMLCSISVPLGYFIGGVLAAKYKVSNIMLIYGIFIIISALPTIKVIPKKDIAL